MRVLGIVGSPRRHKGISHQVIATILEGARESGAEIETIYLIDDGPQYCIHCGHDCFGRGDCAQEKLATVRSETVDAADALVLAAPVYCWQPSGLTATLFDKVRLGAGPWSRGTRNNGRAALGIAVAGGSGSGVFPALQSIYAWLCLWKFRPMDPLPVTRFNLSRALDDAPALGRALAESQPQPFDDVAELMLRYDALPYTGYGRVDEFRWLAEQIAAGLDGGEERFAAASRIRALLSEAGACGLAGDQAGEAHKVIEAYRTGAAAW